jgi:hypothetical protein
MATNEISFFSILQNEKVCDRLLYFLRPQDLLTISLLTKKFQGAYATFPLIIVATLDNDRVWKALYLHTFGEKTHHLPNDGKEVLNLRRKNKWKKAYILAIEMIKNPIPLDPFKEHDRKMNLQRFLNVINKPFSQLSYDGSVPEAYKRRAQSVSFPANFARERTETI